MTEGNFLQHDIPIGALTSIIFRTRSIILNNQLKSLNISAGQFPIMMYLLKHQNVTQETLARHFHIDRGTIARSVKKLEDAGYIIRTIDPENRRAVRLFLSEQGRTITPELIRIDTNWEETVSTTLTGPEKMQFREILMKVATASIQGIRDTGNESYGSCCTRGDCV